MPIARSSRQDAANTVSVWYVMPLLRSHSRDWACGKTHHDTYAVLSQMTAMPRRRHQYRSAAVHAMGLATISQKTPSNAINAGTPSQNHVRA